MASTAAKSTGVQIVGIDPEEEKDVFSLYKNIIPGTGDYFESESKYNMAFIGEDLAKELNIIRFSIDSTVITKLKAQGIPEVILEKLSPLTGLRFSTEKKFIKKLNSLFTKPEASKYGQMIRKEAWSYRKGSRFTLTFLDKENNQVGAVFRITSLYDIKNNIFEQSMVFVRDADLKRLTGFDKTSFHQIVVRIKNIKQTEEITKNIRRMLPDLEVMSWKELQPDLAMMSDMANRFYAVFMIIILAALAFGIVNTMLMVVLERTKELGMLTAIGMNKRRVFSMIMLESVFLSLIGGLAGMIISWVVILFTAKEGINFAQYAEGFEAWGYSAHIYPQIGAGFFVVVTFLIILTGILSSIYPALKALKLNPSDAIRSD
jgi:ABC-type lipoprotein release transport system permease subunit